eukprot:GCRY01002755.1.p1 GENE.GCRY01002755.1~~GCRY01002755.1.p1  ORF type:complete len:292 (-),score=33.66 GCRY01002755.1:77-952(-)
MLSTQLLFRPVSSLIKRSFANEALGKVITVTSGKGGVGKTTTAASFSYGLASKGHRVCAIDFDIGLRNLDLHLGMERRVVFDFINVINQECNLQQALIQDRKVPNLHLLAASLVKDKSALKISGVERIMNELKESFDYILCDSPAGIENGALHAMYFADEALIVTNPEISSVRDSDKMIGILDSKSYRAVNNLPKMKKYIAVTRYAPEQVQSGSMLSIDDIQEMFGDVVIGVLPESKHVINMTNRGLPVIAGVSDGIDVSLAYADMVERYLGRDVPMRFLDPPGLFSRLFK